ncbi:MAG: nuclear transport factor 2 family protein [Anaerolineae bacterium]
MTELDKRNIELVRLMYTGADAERANIAQDIVWHVPGHNPVSGDYHGFDEYTQLMPARMAPLTRWEFTLEDMMVNGYFVMVTFHVDGERKGKTISIDGGHVMRVSTDGKVVEGWGFTADQDVVDDFFSA